MPVLRILIIPSDPLEILIPNEVVAKTTFRSTPTFSVEGTGTNEDEDVVVVDVTVEGFVFGVLVRTEVFSLVHVFVVE